MDVLEDWAAPVLEAWPTGEPADLTRIVLSADTLPSPVSCASHRLGVRRGSYYGGSFIIDQVEFFGAKDALASLGLLIFSAVFHEGMEDVEVTLVDPSSDVKTVKINRVGSDSSGRVAVRPLSFDYIDTVRDDPMPPLFPHMESWMSAMRAPHVRLTTDDDWPVSEEDRGTRDVLVGFGGLGGSARFAELLLNISRPWVSQTEIELKGWPGADAGFAVQPGSAWVRILLSEDRLAADDG